MKKIICMLCVLTGISDARTMTPQDYIAAGAAAGAGLWAVGAGTEVVVDRFGQNRPQWMRNTGILAGAQSVGNGIAMTCAALLGFVKK